MIVLICVCGLYCVFGEGVVCVYVLCGIDLDIEVGEFVVIVGILGLGKFILMNIFGLLDCFSGGSYYLVGQDVLLLLCDQFVVLCNWLFGFVFQ